MIPIIIFIITVALTLCITWWAARRSHGTAGFYTAEAKITAGQNGLAITGDFISAAGLLGTAALYFSVGLDSVIFLVSPLVGLCLLLLLMAGPLRRLGKFTLGDVLAAKLPGQKLRVFTGISTVVLSEVYLVAQFVAAGSLFAAIFEVSFHTATVGVAGLIMCYVVFGGMLATTWVQIIKAVLLIAGVLFTAVLCVVHAGGFGPLYERAQAGLSFPIGSFGASNMGLFATASLSTALILGMMGMPHLLIRFLTVPDVRAAKQSVAVAAAVVAFVQGIVMLIIGPAGIAFVKGVPAFESTAGAIRGGNNMILLHLASALGGEVLFGLLASVAFTTILAVVAGLTIALAASAAHDI
jgi:cation/acetate symporter